MPRYGKWETIRELGGGGQGVVYLAHNTEVFDREKLVAHLRQAISNIGAVIPPPDLSSFATQMLESLGKLLNPFHHSYIGALKVLHGMGPSTDVAKARERMSREVETSRRVTHPSLLRILDADIERGWFVGEYHDRGPLSQHLHLFRGDLIVSLRAFRSIVDAVATLHAIDIVHRDIKPANIFLASDGRLVLGDMGLVFFVDEQGTRVTDTYENVGSRDWMPGWALGMRIEEVRPTFDVFSLGKLYWSMLSGKPLLQLWYWDDLRFDVEKMFPNGSNVRWARHIFEKCVVQWEKDCLPNAGSLLKVVDELLSALDRNTHISPEGVTGSCLACGLGTYRRVAGPHGADLHNFGVRPAGMQGFFVFTCDRCGHVQLFSLPNGPEDLPAAWKQRRRS